MGTNLVSKDMNSDMDNLLRSLSGNRAMANKLANMYLGMYPRMRANLHAALDASDAHALAKAAHEVRGSCVMFSARRCIELARDIEEQAKILPIEDLHADCALLDDALDALAGELRRFVDEPITNG